MFRKSLIVLMVILNMLFFQDAFADTNFSPATPDVLIILDLSTSMSWNPQDEQSYIYGANLSCVANTTACNMPTNPYSYNYGDSTCIADLNHANPADATPMGCGTDITGSTYIYGSDISCTANTDHADAAHNNIGCGSDVAGSYIYAHDASCKSDTNYCGNKTGNPNWNDCSGGFCKSSHSSGTTYDCRVNCDCSGGFCKNSKTGCAIKCNCSGGYCKTAKGGCDTNCTQSDCSNGFCSNTTQGDCQTNCSKIEIAKRALAALLDDAGTDNKINSDDDKSLAVRIGYMRYVNNVATVVQDFGTPYAQVFCGSTGSSGSCNTTDRACVSGDTNSCIAGASPNGYTPLAQSVRDAKTYLDNHDNSASECRQKSVILITDGSDTLACGGGGGGNPECATGSYQRRRQSVAAAKYLNASGYKLYVIGFGASMPDYLTYTLNWMAYFGGTNNPSTDEKDTGDVTAYDPTIGGTLNISSASSCPTASITTKGTCQGNNYNDFFAASQDPGNTKLLGYAFMAGDADLLSNSLKMIISQIKASAYSFSQSSVQATRTKDENYIYEASFYPADKDPFWIGHLRRFSILTDTNGNSYINSTADWDAGSQSSGQSNRNIFTYINNGRISFFDNTTTPPQINTSITNAYLGLTSDNTGNNKRDVIYTFFTAGETNTVKIQGVDTTYTNWMLGDIYHFSPVTIGVPNQYYVDTIDTSSGTACATISTTNAYAQFYCQHTDRTSAGGKRIILAGANDGQFHAFKAAAKGDGGGTEVWSFIPPNFLPSLQLIAHTAHPTTLTHTYFVDGSVGAFDVWWSNVGTDKGDNKKVADWHTLAVINEGRGGNANSTLWSQSASCDNASYPKGFNSKYVDATNKISYPHYCGYWALDVTDTTSLPTVQWHLRTDPPNDKTATSVNDYTAAAHLGDPWSKMVMGRVKISGKEKWVGFIGGGYSSNDCSDHATACSDLRGKGFYIVDLKDGSILWKWTNSTVSIDNTKTPWTITATSNNNNMDYDLASIAGIIDTDGDGFIDTAYIGDAGGNVWRFNFCSKAQGDSCDTSNWSMAKLYNSNNAKTPIYTLISSTAGDPQYDAAGTWWLFFGTGDSTNPNKFNTSDKFFAVKDINSGSSGVVLSDLKNISASTFNNSSTGADTSYKGFYINLNHTDAKNDYGEKMMANPTIFEGVLFFSTYLPIDACLLDGNAYIYAIDFNNSGTGVSGTGLLKDTDGNATRSLNVGTGVTSSPIVSYAPNLQGADVFISTSQSSTGSLTQKISLGNLFNFQKSKLLYWHDMRVQ
jgi:Tfp pilus tip-associated adhesin PilY1